MRSLPRPSSSRTGRRALLIAAVLFVSYVYFYPGPGWNQNSHFYLAKALLEQHTVRIDRYRNFTGDEAFYEGHYYSDKAPGLSLTALPAIKAGGPIALRLGVRPRITADVQLYLASVFTCSLGIALAAAVLFWLLLKWNTTSEAAAFAALIFGLGTPMWIYATLFWGHALASACLVFAFAAADTLRRCTSSAQRVGLMAAVGLAAGWAVVVEYPAAIPAVMLGGMASLYCWRTVPRLKTFLYGSAALSLTAGLCLATLLIYQKAAFGSPFRLGYEYVVNFQDTLHRGALGISYPSGIHSLRFYLASAADCCFLRRFCCWCPWDFVGCGAQVCPARAWS